MGNFLERFGGPLFFLLALWMMVGTPIMLHRGGILYQILGFFPIGIFLLFMAAANISSMIEDHREGMQNGKFWPQ